MSIPYAAGALTLLALISNAAAAFPADIFGFREVAQQDIGTFPQWVDVLERHLKDNLDEGDCSGRRMTRCHLAEWQTFLGEIANLPRREQIDRINRYANTKDYVLDLENYGVNDLWAIPRQFLYNGGDCEDYAITKFFSLRWLGFPQDDMRIVILQDTNLRIPHAIIALSAGDDILILDNQVQRVVSHREIIHYAPVYSINTVRWWMHTPE